MALIETPFLDMFRKRTSPNEEEDEFSWLGWWRKKWREILPPSEEVREPWMDVDPITGRPQLRPDEEPEPFREPVSALDPFAAIGEITAAPFMFTEEGKRYRTRINTLLERQAATKDKEEKARIGQQIVELREKGAGITPQQIAAQYEQLPLWKQMAAEIPGFVIASPAFAAAMPLKVFRWLGTKASIPGVKAILPTAGQVVLAPLAGLEYGLGRGLVYLGKGVQLALKKAGASIKFIDRFVFRRELEQAQRALKKIEAGKEPTRTETWALRHVAEIAEQAEPTTVAGAVSVTTKTKFIEAIKTFAPLRGEAEAQVHRVRQEISARLGQVYERIEGIGVFDRATKALRAGRIIKPIPGAIEEQFTGAEIDSLFNAVRTTKAIPEQLRLTRYSVLKALSELLTTNKLPERGMLVWFERVFGEEFAKAVLSRRAWEVKAWEHFLNAVNLPKAAMASWDFSVTLRQLGVLFWGHPREVIGTIAPQIKTFFEGGLNRKTWEGMSVAQRQEITRTVFLGDEVAQKLWKSLTYKEKRALGERYFAEMDNLIRNGGEAELKRRAKLDLPDVLGISPELAALPEEFMSRFARHLPLTRRSERAFVLGGNKARSDIFDHTIGKWRQAGIAVDETTITKGTWNSASTSRREAIVEFSGIPRKFHRDILRKTWDDLTPVEREKLGGFWHVEDLAKYINDASGRGNPGRLREMMVGLNAFMFSPRYVLSRLALPRHLISRSPAVRKMAARDMASFIGVNSGILALLSLSGVAEVELNPLSTDFGKIRVGNTRLEFWAGFQPYVRFAAQFISGARKTTTGRFQKVNRWELLTRFMKTKRSPAVGIVQDILSGRTFEGDEIEDWRDILDVFFENFAPLSVQDVIEAIEEEGLVGGYVALPSIYGAGIVSYDSANQVVGEVYYAMTQYQDAQRKLRELVEEKNAKKLRKFIEDSPDAQWARDKGTLFSNTGRMLAQVARELDKLRDAREKVEKMEDIDTKLQQEAIDEINRRMIKIATDTMLDLDLIKDKAGTE